MENALRTDPSQPQPDNHAGHPGKLTVCPNCDMPLPHHENYCPNCGQQNHELKLPLGHLLYEVIENITHFDDKLWRTLKAIFTRPGQMTADFLAGKRVRYVPPVRLYVFVSVIFFFLIGKFIDARTERGMEESAKKEKTDKTATTESVDFATLVDNDSLLRRKDLYLLARINVDVPTDSVAAGRWLQSLRSASDARLDTLLKEQDEVQAALTPDNRRKLRQVIALIPDDPKVGRPGGHIQVLGVNVKFKDEKSRGEFLGKLRQMSDAQLDSLIRAEGGEPGWYKRTFLRQTGKFMASKEDSTKSLMHVVLKNLSGVMFVLMPFVAILLLLFYYRRGRYYYEHLIFSVHIHTVIFLFFSLALLGTYYTDEATTDTVLNSMVVVCWLYFLWSLKTVYRQGWLKTTVKFLLLSFSYVLVASIFTLGAVLWGFVTF